MIFLILIVVGSWIHHSIVIKKEVFSTPPPGKMLDVDGHLVHVYSEVKSNINNDVFEVLEKWMYLR